MNAIIVEKFGSEKQLKFSKETTIPEVSNNLVLVKIYAAGINPVDTYIRSGTFAYLPELPFVPGKDGAGIVTKVGENVSKFKPGDRVFVCKRGVQNGTYAQYTLVAENDVFHLDEALTFEEGAALGIPYFTAYRALVIRGKCQSGETVLVHGASGAVGLACVQIAKKFGLCVIGTAGSKEGMDLVKSLGADYVLCHKDKNYLNSISEITGNSGVNFVIEMLADKNLSASISVCGLHARIAIVGSRGCHNFYPRDLFIKEITIFGIATVAFNEEEWTLTASAIQKGIEEGWVRPIIHKTYLLEEAAQAHHDIIHASGALGKRVLSINT